ncbi:hypothetical protein M427DRAFT_156882 [Gonapodya prolifera JEL478]|uniref:Uncharacterized protein n=1 Tax=Gonapodya prolifera (strain JEL478) TaxID=1344416 RepID=A0A139A979_GONPJ|nr:hypothetical protein M427DRAFT_156882 [Gonapodya prolifera JEL478]|eukprot:KXS13219.1 hypothetical protein M427DRAFT_156882 [Gonapodya prolifera JEL478]
MSASELVTRGMRLFVGGDIAASIRAFDDAMRLDPKIRPRLWQRGLSLYYADRFQDGAEQFAIDVSYNPNDTEESVWHFLCLSRMYNPSVARSRWLHVGQDPRPVMRAVYDVFHNPDAIPQAILDAARDTDGHDSFYAKLYVGLWWEAHEGPTSEGARRFLVESLDTGYGKTSQDYMVALARVHCRLRGWDQPGPNSK